jgi:ABC-type transport system substrate-binding protein
MNLLNIKSYLKLPSWQQFKRLHKILTKKEKLIFSIFIFLFLISGLYLITNFYLKNTKEVPAIGGILKEGIVGELRSLNPIYATSSPELDVIELLFSGLMKYNEKGEIVPQLAESYQIKEEGKVYIFTLKKGLLWSDKKPITVDDLIFTVKILKDPAYKSPFLASWLDIKAEKISERSVKFTLKNPYLPFLELATFKIIPKHIWQEILADKFHLSQYNLRPITSGPYILEKIEQDDFGFIKKIILKRNSYYHDEKPFIKKIILVFLNTQTELLAKSLGKEINAFSFQPSIKNLPPHFKINQVILPRYFALFFNQEKSDILKEKKIRQALALATDKSEIIKKAIGGQGEIINSPILPEIYGFKKPTKEYPFNKLKAQLLLEEIGFNQFTQEKIRKKIIKEPAIFEFTKNLSLGSRGKEVKFLQKCLAKDPEVYPEGIISGYFGKKTEKAVIKFQEKYKDQILIPQNLKKGTGKVRIATRAKLNEICFPKKEKEILLELSLVTVDQSQLKKIAEIIKKQWQKIGVKLKIKTLHLSELEKEIIRKRNYEILLFGQVLGSLPDLYPFWHSNQRKDPGLNLANYSNKEVDNLLIKARQAKTKEEMAKNYEKLQEIILEDLPAIFLYSPYYLYFQPVSLKGFKLQKIIDPSKRFSDIENWYFKTKRIWK